MTRHLVFCAIFMAVSFFSSYLPASQFDLKESASKAAELLTKAKEVRMSMKSGEFEVNSKFEGEYVGSFAAWNYNMNLKFDGDKERFEKKEGTRTTVTIRQWPGKDDFLFFSSEPKGFRPPTLPPELAHIRQLPLAKLELFPESERYKSAHRETADVGLPSIRAIGAVPSSLLDPGGLDLFCGLLLNDLKLLEQSDRLSTNQSFELSTEDLDGVSCSKIFHRRLIPLEEKPKIDGGIIPDEVSCTLWIAPEQGYAIIRSEIITEFNGMLKVVEKHRAKVILNEESGLWLPSEWTFEEFRNGKQRTKERNTLKVISINQPFDSKTFTPLSIDLLKEGTPVHWNLSTQPPASGDLIWDGEKIVSAEESFIDPHLVRRRWIIILVNVAFVLLILSLQLYKASRKGHFLFFRKD